MKKKVVDFIDLQIINTLQKDASLTNKELAEKIGMSAPPILIRVQNLWKRKIISSYQAKVAPSYFKYNHIVTATITVAKKQNKLFLNNLDDQREAVYCARLKSTKGNDNVQYLVILLTKSPDHYKECIESLLKNNRVSIVEHSEIEKVIKDQPLKYTADDLFD